MPLSSLRVVIDTNTRLRGLAKPHAASGQVISNVETRNLLLLTSDRVVDEYRLILTDTEIIGRHPTITVGSVEATIRGLVYVSEYFRALRTAFDFPRDPKDEKFLALAI